MSRVITFSREFPAYHPKAKTPTFFVEKIWESLSEISVDEFEATSLELMVEALRFSQNEFLPKHHTIRASKRWKVGDKFSPRVWSGKPYNSKMITIAPDLEIKKIWDFDCFDGLFFINGTLIDVTSSDIPENDGLSSDDFLSWFPETKEFRGQILCWNENINY